MLKRPDPRPPLTLTFRQIGNFTPQHLFCHFPSNRMAELNDVAKIRLFNKRRDKGLSVCPIPPPPAVFALFTAPAAAGAEERARAGGPADRRRLLRHHPGEAGPEEPAGGGGLQRRPRPGPQRAAQHRQHAAGVVSGAASHSICCFRSFLKNLFFTVFFLSGCLPSSLTGAQAARRCFVGLRSKSQGQTNTERAS